MSNWWDDLQPAVDVGNGDDIEIGGYSADETIEGNHNTLADLRNNDFDLRDPSYAHGLWLVGGLFVLVGLVALLLLRCLIAYAVKRKSRLFERLLGLQDAKSTRGKTFLVLAVLGLAALACAVGSLFDVELRMTRIEDFTLQIVDALLTAFSLPDTASTSLARILSAYVGVQEGVFSSCSLFGYIPGDVADIFYPDELVDELVEGVTGELMGIEGSGIDELAARVAGISSGVKGMRDIRYGTVWPTIILCLGLVSAYLCIAVREYRGSGQRADAAGDDIRGSRRGRGRGRCDSEKRNRCLRFFTLVLAFLVWMAAACALTLSAMTGDFCSDLQSSVDSILDDASQSPLLGPLVDYYTGDCSERNLAVESIAAAQAVAEATVGVTMDILTTVVDTCSDASDDAEVMDASLKDLWGILDEGGQLVSCSFISGLFRSAVWDEMCRELPKGLMALLVSCIMLSVVLVLLWVQWTFMLWKRETDSVDKAEEPNDKVVSLASLTPPELGMAPLGEGGGTRTAATVGTAACSNSATTVGNGDGVSANDDDDNNNNNNVELPLSPPPAYR